MSVPPEVEALRSAEVCGEVPGWVPLPDAEQAVRDAEARVRREELAVLDEAITATRQQAVRECVEALRERANNYTSQVLQVGFRYAADFIERTFGEARDGE